MRSRMLASVFPGGHAECCRRQAVPAAKSKGKGRYLPKDVAAVAMILLTGLLIAYTGA